MRVSVNRKCMCMNLCVFICLFAYRTSCNLVTREREQSEFRRKWNRRFVWLENHRSHTIIIVIFVCNCLYLFADKFIEYVFFKEHIGIRRVVGIWAGVSRYMTSIRGLLIQSILVDLHKQSLSQCRCFYSPYAVMH